MKIRAFIPGITVLTFAAVAGLSAGPSSSPSPAASSSEADMMAQMMELAKPGPNHQLLSDLVGNWDYKVKLWMAPGAPAVEAHGTSTTKEVMGGRYFATDVTGKMPCPGPDGKMTEMDFKGQELDGYDNVKRKFVSSWIDNMGTGIVQFEGTYDAATRTFTYVAEAEMMPGVKTRMRETLQMLDKDHRLLEWFETQGGKEVKTMEIAYTRTK